MTQNLQRRLAFDYYRATIDCSADLFLEQLFSWHPERDTFEISAAPSVRYYDSGNEVRSSDGRRICQVYYHRANTESCNVLVSGSATPEVVKVIRALGAAHRPSRVDSAVNFAGSKAFGECVEWSRGFAETNRLKRVVWTNDDPDQGSTIYLGSRASESFVRIYQPGLKNAAEEGRTGEKILPSERDAVRFEFEFKPAKRAAKNFAAAASPLSLFGGSGWARVALGDVLGLRVEPVRLREVRQMTDSEKALRFMSKQYRAHLLWLMHETGGDFGAFGEKLYEWAIQSID